MEAVFPVSMHYGKQAFLEGLEPLDKPSLHVYSKDLLSPRNFSLQGFLS